MISVLPTILIFSTAGHIYIYKIYECIYYVCIFSYLMSKYFNREKTGVEMRY